MDPMGPNAETVLDYSVYDAIRAGFTRVVFIIREDFAEAFQKGVGARFQDEIKVDYVFQKLEDLPVGFTIPEGRQKPWGTAHAVLAARDCINEPFAVINADDFYGADSYQQMAQYFRETTSSIDSKSHYCMVGYHIDRTLSDHGDVNRGICTIEDTFLTDVEEYMAIKREDSGVIYGNALDASRRELAESTIVSMNFWGFTPEFFTQLQEHFTDFLSERGSEMKSESYLPSAVDEFIKKGQADCKVLETTSSWFGVTYPDDKAIVVESIQQLIEAGVYPSPLH